MADKYVKLDDIIDTLELEWGYEGMREELEKLPAADVAPVVFCRNCTAHNSCTAERNFLSEGITEPFCCRGNLKTNIQEVKK